MVVTGAYVVAQAQVADEWQRGQQVIGIGQRADVVVESLQVYLGVQVSQQTVACGPSIPIQEILEALREAARQVQRVGGVSRQGLGAERLVGGEAELVGYAGEIGNCSADGRRDAVVRRGAPPQEAALNERIEVIHNVFTEGQSV